MADLITGVVSVLGVSGVVQVSASVGEFTAPRGAPGPAGAPGSSTNGQVEVAPDAFEITDGDGNLLIRVTATGIQHPAFAALVAAVAAGEIAGSVVSLEIAPDGFAVTDSAGNLLFKATPTDILHPAFAAVKTQAAAGAVAGASVSVAVAPDGFVVTDDHGNILFRVDASAIDHPQVAALQSGLAALTAGAAASNWSELRALGETIHLLAYGQSLSVGALARPALTTAPLAYGQRFTHGVRYEDAGSDDSAVVYAGLVSFAERDTTVPDADGSLYGETPLGGCLQMIHQLLLAEDGVDLATANQMLLGSAPGHKGEALTYLQPGGPFYPRLVNDLTYGASLSTAAGRAYTPGAVVWLQGEADYGAGTGHDDYQAALRSLRLAMEATAQAATGLIRPMPLVTYQTSTHLFYGRATPTVALAQLDLAGDRYIAFASPTYFLSYSDQQHLTNVSSKWLGAYFGIVLKRWLWDGVKPAPLTPSATARMGSRVLVSFSLQSGRKLVIDTAAVADPGHYGFTLAGPDGSAIAISSVALVGRETVRVTATAAIPPGSELRYAWVGDANKGLGCIRDNAGDSLVFDPGGINKPMHNWLPICRIGIS